MGSYNVSFPATRALARHHRSCVSLGVIATRLVKTALLLTFVLVASRGLAREEPIPNSTSPDTRFYVAVEEVGAHIYYRVKETRTGRNRFAFPSEYQSDAGELPDWSYRHALSCEVHWRDQSQCVALDESNHNRIGTVLIACRTKNGFRRVPLDRWALPRLTGDDWNKSRLFFGGWGSGDTAIVYLIGLIYIDTATVERRRYKERSYTFTVDLKHNGRIITRKLGDNFR